ncbi:neuromedin-U isoform X1 [Paroedura picta]|uniref:neuromedin-U isoform X1 n=1 Tax=Paroedura picta TaxID=143630 RepID=UPI004057591B
MRRAGGAGGRQRPGPGPPSSVPRSPGRLPAGRREPGRRLRVLFLVVLGLSWCRGAPMTSNVLQGEQDFQLWNEIDDVCSAYLDRDAQPQSSNALEELCFMVLGLLQKTQGLDEKDNTKRFLFHYSKTHDTGNSDYLLSVLHPLLQLVPQLHERRPKRYKVVDEELRIPGGIQSRGYFIFRPRNGRRSTAFR